LHILALLSAAGSGPSAHGANPVAHMVHIAAHSMQDTALIYPKDGKNPAGKAGFSETL